MLNWVNRFNIFCLLDNLNYDFEKTAFECLLAAGFKKNIRTNAGNAFDTLRKFYAENKNEWLFGHFGYDLKNETEKLNSYNFDGIGFADLHFFVPEVVIQLGHNRVSIIAEDEAEKIYQQIING